MPIHDLKAQIARLPEQPGVYLYFDARRRDDLRRQGASAARSCAQLSRRATGSTRKTDALLDEIDRLEVIVTDSVVEALALENNLIKQRLAEVQHPAARRQELSLPAADDGRGVPARAGGAARRARRHVYAGPFLPARLARRTMALTHRLFGIRSCNEVITGKRARPCLEYDIKRCLAPCVDDDLHARRSTSRPCRTRGCSSRAATRSSSSELRGRMAEARRRRSGSKRRRSLRDAMRTVQTLRERQQKMATPELGDRDVFGVKVGRAGAVVQVFQVRGGRVVERVELVTESEARPRSRAESDVLAGGGAAVLRDQPGAARSAPAGRRRGGRGARGVAERSARSGACGCWCRSAATRRGCVDLATRNATLAYRRRFDAETRRRTTRRSRRCARCCALPALPRRIECFDISTIQGSETVASMVVCEDGRMRHRASTEASSAIGQAAANPGRGESARFLDDFAAMQQVVARRYRRVLEDGGPFPDLIVIDGGKGQLRAAYDGARTLGLANLVAVGLAKKEELIFTRDRAEPIALDAHDPALRLLQRIRDEAHRFAVTFHRTGARHARPAVGARCVPGIGAAPAQDAARRVRQPRGRAPSHARGTGVVGAKRRRDPSLRAAIIGGRRVRYVGCFVGAGVSVKPRDCRLSTCRLRPRPDLNVVRMLVDAPLS